MTTQKTPFPPNASREITQNSTCRMTGFPELKASVFGGSSSDEFML